MKVNRNTSYLFLHTDLLIISEVANMKDTFKTMKSQLSELKEIFETIQPITEPPEKVRHTHSSSNYCQRIKVVIANIHVYTTEIRRAVHLDHCKYTGNTPTRMYMDLFSKMFTDKCHALMF